MKDLLVVGLDLETDTEVHCDEAQMDALRARGYSGDRTLICALCYAGQEAPVGTRTPLVVRGREGGARRAHFAHPPGHAPPGGHSPESLWHLGAKHLLADWANTQPNVTKVDVERWTSDLKRRADVYVRLVDEAQLAFEVQATRLSDPAWLARHRDYRNQGIVDEWLWRPTTDIHWIASKHGLPL